MKAINVRTPEAPWISGSALLGPGAIHAGREIVRFKLLSDRRAEGGGIAYLLNLIPPTDKIVRTIAVARSDENVYVLEGGYCNKLGEIIHPPGDYILNPEGHPHSVMVARDTTTLVICRGQPDEVQELGVIDRMYGDHPNANERR